MQSNNLAVISFVCSAFLVLFLPIARVRKNVATLAIVSWLLGANIVHGVNTIIWAGNVVPHAPVWCDIVTKLLVGATIALPGAVLTIARRLELVSSVRTISKDPSSQTTRFVLDFGLCYFLPILYMGLHFIVQDHRFDLVEDYGCSASIQSSTLGLTLMWLPPILLCCASLFLCGASISHSFNMPTAAFALHLEQRDPVTHSIFPRRLTLAIITSAVLLVVSLFSVFTISKFVPWTSWSAVHANFTTIHVVQSPDEARSIKLVWLGVPIVSLVYIALVLAFGEETRDAAKWIHDRVRKIPRWRPRPMLLLPLFSAQTRSDLETHVQLSSPAPSGARPGLDLKSGWDDMLDSDSRKSKLWTPSRKSPSMRTVSPAPITIRDLSPLPSRTSTPSPSPTTISPTVCGEEDTFMKSTLDYLGSPVAQTLGISPPHLIIPTSSTGSSIASPPFIYVSPRKAAPHDKTGSPTSVRSLHNAPPSPRRVPTDVESVISSVFDMPWPQPPPSPPHFADVVSRPQVADSRSASPVSAISTDTACLPSTTSPQRHRRPFEGSSISSSIIEVPISAQARSKRAPSVRGLMKTFSSEKVQDVRPPIIYMHVVNEVS